MEQNPNIKEKFLENFAWHINETPSTEITEKSPIEKNNFRVEGHTPTEIFIRELGQNALDAKLKTKEGPVEIVINEIEIDNEKKGLYQKVFSSRLKNLLEDSGDIEKGKYKPKFKALVISDYGTRGLESNVNRRESDWYKYWHVVGSQNFASKQNQLGSANQGKIAIWGFSSLSTVLGITKLRGGITRAQGKCIMSNFSDNPSNGKVRDCHTFFRKNQNEESISYDLDSNEINQFNYLFNIKPRTEFDYGTDFILIESEDINENLLLIQTIRNWAIPIAEDKIKFNIFNKILDKNNIYSLLDEYAESLSGLSTDFINFCIEARKKQNKTNHKIYKLKKDLSYESFKGSMLNNSLFEDGITSEDILKEFNNYKIIEIQYEPKIIYKEKPNTNDHFSTYLKKINFKHKDVPYVETPTKNLLSLFRRAAGLSAYYLNESDIESDPDYFSDWFNDSGGEGKRGDDNDKKKKKKKKRVGKIPPTKLPGVIDMQQENGIITIKSLPKYEYKEGDEINLQLAANLPSGCGNPFSNYTVFDFNLREMNVIQEEGCTIKYAELNQMTLEPYQTKFEIKLSGFWDKWGSVMNSKIERRG